MEIGVLPIGVGYHLIAGTSHLSIDSPLVCGIFFSLVKECFNILKECPDTIRN